MLIPCCTSTQTTCGGTISACPVIAHGNLPLAVSQSRGGLPRLLHRRPRDAALGSRQSGLIGHPVGYFPVVTLWRCVLQNAGISLLKMDHFLAHTHSVFSSIAGYCPHQPSLTNSQSTNSSIAVQPTNDGHCRLLATKHYKLYHKPTNYQPPTNQPWTITLKKHKWVGWEFVD